MTPFQAVVIYRSVCRLVPMLTGACVCRGLPCRICESQWLLIDAASIASDMAEAERLSGRNPRGALSREIPLS